MIAAGAISEFGSVILLSFFFSSGRPGIATELVHLSAFALLAVIVFLSSARPAHARLIAALERLREGSARVQARADLALVAVVVGITSSLGLEAILAAFTVGVIRGMTEERSERFEERRDAVALGIFVPFFFVCSGLDFHLAAAFRDLGGVIRLPLFVVALLLCTWSRPALSAHHGPRRAIAAGLLQATSFSFVIVAAQIGLQLHVMVAATATSLVGAGLISVIAFPAIAFSLLGEAGATALARRRGLRQSRDRRRLKAAVVGVVPPALKTQLGVDQPGEADRLLLQRLIGRALGVEVDQQRRLAPGREELVEVWDPVGAAAGDAAVAEPRDRGRAQARVGRAELLRLSDPVEVAGHRPGGDVELRLEVHGPPMEPADRAAAGEASSGAAAAPAAPARGRDQRPDPLDRDRGADRGDAGRPGGGLVPEARWGGGSSSAAAVAAAAREQGQPTCNKQCPQPTVHKE